jgi:hypothetical protein
MQTQRIAVTTVLCLAGALVAASCVQSPEAAVSWANWCYNEFRE